MTIALGETARLAAMRLAALWGVTRSEAIRRALIEVDREISGSSRESLKRARAAALNRARDVFASVDLEAEIQRIRQDRDRW